MTLHKLFRRGSWFSGRVRIGVLLALGTVLYFFANFQRIAVPGAIFNELQVDLGVSAACITAFGATFMYIYAVNQLFIGMLVDRYGGIRVIGFGALLFCAGSILFPCSRSMPILFISRGLVGLGASAIYLSMVKELVRNFPKRFTFILGIMLLIGYSGAIVANAPLILCVDAIGWRTALLLAGAVAFVAWAAFVATAFFVRQPEIQKVPLSFRPFLEVLRKPSNRRLALFSSCNFGLCYCFQTIIGKKFLEDFCRMSSPEAAWYMSLMAILAAVSGFGSAVFSSLLDNRRRPFIRFAAIAAVATFGAVMLALLFDWRGHAIVIFFCVLAWSANMGPINVAVMKETNSPETVGTVVSFCNCCAYVTVALLGNAVGLLMDLFPPVRSNGISVYGRGSYTVAFSILFLAALCCFFSGWKIKETHPGRE